MIQTSQQRRGDSLRRGAVRNLAQSVRRDARRQSFPLITSIDGVDFEEAWPDRVSADYGGQSVSVISRKHLIQNKKAAGRPQDVADVYALEKLDA
jgi:hypothetical protein